MKRKDLTGLRFGILTVLKHVKTVRINPKRYETYWLCRDDYGFEKELTSKHILSGQIKSCGGLIKRQGKDHPKFTGIEDIGGFFLSSIRNGARNREIEFSVSSEYLWDLFLKQDRKCALSGMDISFAKANKDYLNQTASLDRIDSSVGYLEGNVQWVHKDVNKMKNAYSQEYFIEICKKVSLNG